MTESTLSVYLTDLRSEVARFLGYDAYDSCVAAEQSDIDNCIKSGLRKFYNAHHWSFLRPVTTLTLWADLAVGTTTITGSSTTVTASASSFYPSMIGKSISCDSGDFEIAAYTSGTVVTVSADASAVSGETFSIQSDGIFQLPDDFGGLNGKLIYDQEVSLTDITVVGEPDIRKMRRAGLAAGTPQYVAIRPKASAGSGGQRFEAIFERSPTTNYDVTYSYYALKNMLTTNNPYPLGGAAHADTIIESCLAAAELKLNDEHGEHFKEYGALLQASIERDRQLTIPQTLGYNRDNSSGMWTQTLKRASSLTYEGTLYD